MDCMIGRPHVYFLKALGQLAAARESFAKLAQGGLILGNDNHIGDIGEYWVRRYYELLGQFKCYAPSKNGPLDLKLKSGACVSVKTLTAWSKRGFGTPVRANSGHWKIFAAVYLDKDLFPEELAIVRRHKLVKQDVFVKNAANRSRRKNPTRAHPRFKWWPWLDHHLVTFRMNDGDMELLPRKRE
jgi:hypothetical protein